MQNNISFAIVNDTAQAKRYFHSGATFFFPTIKTFSGCPYCLKTRNQEI